MGLKKDKIYCWPLMDAQKTKAMESELEKFSSARLRQSGYFISDSFILPVGFI